MSRILFLISNDVDDRELDNADLGHDQHLPQPIPAPQGDVQQTPIPNPRPKPLCPNYRPNPLD
jgi:hypothetical protein